MTYNSKKLIVWWRMACLRSKIRQIYHILFLPIVFLHEYMHFIFAYLLGIYEDYKVHKFMKVTGYSISTLHMCIVTEMNELVKFNWFLCLIVITAPCLIPFILVLLFGKFGFILCLLNIRAWFLSNADIRGVILCLNKLKFNFHTQKP